MNKAELIDSIADKTGHSHADTIKTLDALLETIESTVAGGDEVQRSGSEPSSRSTGSQGQGATRRPANHLRLPRRPSQNSPPASPSGNE